jgi:hypothetical protein
MNSSEPNQWQNAYTENKGFADSLKRTGGLLIPVIVTMIVPMFYAIFYLLDLLSRAQADDLPKSVQIQYTVLGIILIFIPIIFTGLIFTFMLKTAGTFLKTFHNLPDSINIKEVVGLRVFGRVPMPPPLSTVIKFPTVNTKDGESDPLENWHTTIGGPVKLKIEPGNAVYLERGDRFSRVVGQGNAFMELHEKIKAVVNVGPHSKTFEVNAWTKDGIKIDLKVKGEYFLGAVERNEQNEDVLIPFDPAAIRNAVEQTLIGGKEGHEWLEGAIGKTKGALSNYISNRHLEEIFMKDNRLFTKPTMDDLLANINKNIQSLGVYLSHFQIMDAQMQPEITKQRLETWETDYKSHKTITESKGKAHLFREREKARAEMQRNLIYTLANGLERINLKNFSEPLLLSIAALLDQSMSDPEVRATLAKEALETLEKTQEVIKYNFQTPGEER